MNNEELVKKAIEAMQFSYSPYSNFKVGVALLTKKGKVFKGCNIENASFSGTICAERTAIFKAVSEGEKDFVKIAITSSSDTYTYPCGICRQIISEFAPNIEIIVYDKNAGIKVHKASELLPHSFDSFTIGGKNDESK